MIKSKNKIKVILTTFGTIEVLELPLQLHKDSFNNALIQVLIPITEDRTETSFVKIYGNTVDSTGTKVWNSQTYSIYYKTNEIMDKFEYAIYEDVFPEEFSTISGDLNLTISYADLNEEGEAIDLITSQPLHLFINGEGYNQNGIQISQYDATVSRINLLSELSVLKLDISKDLPLGIVFNKEGFKSPFYKFYTSDNVNANLDYILPINSDSTATKQCSIVANNMVKDSESPEVIGYQTEFAFFDGGICQRTNKYNISQGSISNYVLLESGEWEIANQDYITLIKEQADQNSEDIETLYRYYNTGTNYLGEYPSQSTLPTDAELNQYVQTNFNRAPQNGDELTFVLLVEDGTDVVYMIKYSEVKATWIETPLPSVEPAKNGTMGIIQGTGEEDITSTRKVLIDIENGEIEDIIHANESEEKESISDHLNRNSQNITHNASDIEAETERAESAEETITNNLNAEISRATTAESGITDALNSEITRATSAEETLETSIETETERATSAENSIAEDLEEEITRAQQAEQTNAYAISAETTRATNAENTLDTDKLDKDNVNANYLKNIVFSVNGDSGVATLTLNNPVTGQTQNIEITVTSPASSTNTGLMTSEMVQALNNAIEDIESLKYIGKQIASFQTYAEAELFDFSTLSNVNENDYFIVYEDESRTEPSEKDKTTRYVCIDNTAPITIDSFQFSGVVDTVLIQVATETSLGGVLSTNTNGYIYVENTGAMKLVGYDNIISSINNLTTAITNETTRAENAEEALSQAITTETTRAQQAEQQNSTAISTEAARAQQAEQANASAISAETQRAQQAEQENASAIETKVDKTTTVAGKPLSANVSLGTLTIKQNSSDIGDYNGETDEEINITTPTATSDLTNNGDGALVNGVSDPYAKVSQIPTNNNQLTNGAGYAKIKIDTASNWETNNPVLSAGEFGYDSTNKITKIGDGSTAWNDLDWFATKSKPTFADSDWETINEVAKSGKAASYFNVGDEKTIELTTGEQVTLVILGFNHDDLTAGGKAAISIGMKDCLSTTYKMNDSNTNVGGWDTSLMRTSTMATLLSQLPADLQKDVKAVNKKTSAGNKSTTITTSSDKLWLFSGVEIDNTTTAPYSSEGVQYDYWKIIKDGTVAANRIKKCNGSARAWWLRSPSVGNSTNFRAISNSGSVYTSGASNSNGVSFGFCI